MCVNVCELLISHQCASPSLLGRDEGLVLRGEGLGGEGMKGWC